jgi:hypothetical protein
VDDGPIGVNLLSDLEYFGRVSTGVVEVRILRIHCFLVSPAVIWSSHPYSLSKRRLTIVSPGRTFVTSLVQRVQRFDDLLAGSKAATTPPHPKPNTFTGFLSSLDVTKRTTVPLIKASAAMCKNQIRSISFGDVRNLLRLVRSQYVNRAKMEDVCH